MGKSRKKVDKTDKNHKSRFAYGEGRSGEDTKFIHGLIVICVLGLITLFVLLSIRKNQVETRDNMRKADLMNKGLRHPSYCISSRCIFSANENS